MKLVIDNTKNQRNNKQLTKPDKETFMSVKTHETKPENWEAIRDKVMELDADVFQYLLEMERDHCKYEFDGDKPDYEFLGFLNHSVIQLKKVFSLAEEAKTLTEQTKPEDWETIRDRIMELDADVFRCLLTVERDHCKYEFNGDKPDYEFLGFLSHSLAQIQIVLDLAKEAKALTKEATNKQLTKPDKETFMSVKTKKIPAFGTRKIARKPLTKKGNETMKYETTIGQIKTPKTVKEFRENLKNYFFTAGEDYLWVRTKDGARDIPINNISSLEDLYELTGTGFDGDGSTPCIVPLIDYEQEKIMDVGKKTGYRSFFGEDYKVYTKEQSLSAQYKVEDPKWFGLDNKILREFYVKVLGDFSGYEVVDVSKEPFPTTTN